MKGNKTALRISLCAVLTAIVVVFTMIVKIPTVKGYLHLGDVAICFAAFTFGPFTGLIAGGLGTAIADLISGYPQWAIISLIVHGIEGLVVGLIVRGKDNMDVSIGRKIIAAVVCIIIVAGGYFLLSGPFISGWATAAGEIPGNTMQAGVGAVVGVLLSIAVRKAYPPVAELAW